jgi:glycosyltransferase involved in cell wall biosynthesis
VLPSVYDAFGLVALDGMAAGLPVIVSENTAAGSDVVRDGVDGFVTPIRDVEVLKDRILRLYQDPALRSEMGKNAAERVKQFSWEVYENRLKEVIEQVIDSKKIEASHAS